MIQNDNFYVSQSEFWNYFYKHRNARYLLNSPGGVSVMNCLGILLM